MPNSFKITSSGKDKETTEREGNNVVCEEL